MLGHGVIYCLSRNQLCTRVAEPANSTLHVRHIGSALDRQGRNSMLINTVGSVVQYVMTCCMPKRMLRRV